MNFQQRITNYTNAAFPAIAVETTEEPRVMADLYAVAAATGRYLWTWSSVDGLQSWAPSTDGTHKLVKSYPDTELLEPALQACLSLFKANRNEIAEAAAKKREPKLDHTKMLTSAVLVLRDAHLFPVDRDPVLSRCLRDVLTYGPEFGVPTIFVSPKFVPPPTIARMVTMLAYSLPNAQDLRAICEQIAHSALEAGASAEDVKFDDAMVRALGGLSTSEASNALSLSIMECGKFDTKVVYREKVAAVKRGGLLEIIEPDPRGLDAIGGLDVLKDWVSRRREMFSDAASEYGLPSPKGVLVVGVPGCGKSLFAKCVGTALDLPVLKLDIGSLFGSLVGESEQKAREALDTAEAVSPCVVWLNPN